MILLIRNAKVVGSTPIIGTILNSSLVYLNQRKARMLWLLAHIYLLLSTGIKLLLGGISGGTIVGCIILNAFKILNVSGSF